MDAQSALVVVSDIVNEFESFVEGFDPEFWSDPEEFPEDCDEETGRFGSEVMTEVGEALAVLKDLIDNGHVYGSEDCDCDDPEQHVAHSKGG